MQNRLRESLYIYLEARLLYVWTVKTQVYLNFIQRSVDKFATSFELTRRFCRTNFVSWEQTKMLATLLRCLRFFLSNSQVDRESALWWSRRDRPHCRTSDSRTWYGLEFENTLSKQGYCWFEPRFDWARLQFQNDLIDWVVFGNGVLRN